MWPIGAALMIRARQTRPALSPPPLLCHLALLHRPELLCRVRRRPRHRRRRGLCQRAWRRRPRIRQQRHTLCRPVLHSQLRQLSPIVRRPTRLYSPRALRRRRPIRPYRRPIRLYHRPIRPSLRARPGLRARPSRQRTRHRHRHRRTRRRNRRTRHRHRHRRTRRRSRRTRRRSRRTRRSRQMSHHNLLMER
jgi:hypothetical protein